MTQAAVDLQLTGDGGGEFHGRPQSFSRKRSYTEDYAGSSQDDEDPSWRPGAAGEPSTKQKKKRRHHHHQRSHHVLCRPDELPNNNVGAAPFHPPPSSAVSSSYSRPSSSSVSVELTEDCDIAWKDFRPLGTEMIICKEGRRMFPSVELMLSGLEPDGIYSVLISVEMMDSCRYRYNEEHGWMTITTGAQPSIPPRMVPHADSRNTGSHFMRKPLSFKTIKMTNNFNTDCNNQLILLSMRKYIPVITVRCHTTGEESVHKLQNCDFIAVTSYQRVEVTQLKIFTNQFAAAFRKRSATPLTITRKASRLTKSECPRTKTTTATSSIRLQSTSDCHDQQSPPSLAGSSASTALQSTDSHKGSPLDPHPKSFPVPPSGCLKTTSGATYQTHTLYPEVEEEEDDSMDEASPCLNSYFTDEPPHIRPFIFQPRYHYGLDPAYHPALLQNSRPPAPRPRPPHPPPNSRHSTSYYSTTNYPSVAVATGGVDKEMLWSSVALFGSQSGGGILGDDSGCFSLGLLGEYI